MSFNAFTCNIPEEKPGYAYQEMKDRWHETSLRIKARMEKLEQVAISLNENTHKIAYAVRKAFLDFDSKKLLVNSNQELLLDVLTASDIAMMIKPSLPFLEWQEFPEFPNAEILVNTWFITTKEWELLRNLGIGGSDTAVIMGLGKFESQSERALFYSKTGKAVSEMAPDDPGRAFIFEYGHVKEPMVIDEFCRRTGAKVLDYPFTFRSKKNPFMICNVDAIVQMPKGDLYIFEAKTTNSQNWEMWKDGIPYYYINQTRHYMCGLDDDRIKGAYIGAIITNQKNDFFRHLVDRNPVLEADLAEREKEWWNAYVVPGVFPPLSGDATKDANVYMKYEAGKPGTKPLILSPDAVKDIMHHYIALEEEKKRLESRLEEVTNNMLEDAMAIHRMGNSSDEVIFEDPSEDGYMFSVGCRVTTRTKIDKDKLEILYPKVWAEVASKATTYSAPSVKRKKIPKKNNPFSPV